MTNTEFQENIKALRNRFKWSQQKMADELGVDVMTVSRWELGKRRPSKLAIRQINRLRRS